jgi:hypothetical protein
MSEPTLEGERDVPSAQELMRSIQNLEQTIGEIRALLQSVLAQSRQVVATSPLRRRTPKPRGRRRRGGDA